MEIVPIESAYPGFGELVVSLRHSRNFCLLDSKPSISALKDYCRNRNAGAAKCCSLSLKKT